MDFLTLLGALVIGIVAALAAGAFSGLVIGKEALGAQLAAYMGGLYGILSGAMAVVIGLIIYSFNSGAI